MPDSPCPRVAGFTLVELIVGLAVLGVLFGFALPSLSRFVAEQRLLGEARRLSEAITLARSEAVKRNAHVVLCATAPTLDCGSARHWHDGWAMFVDENADAGIDPGEAILGREGAAADGVTLVGNRPVATYFRFNYSGEARMASGALQMGTVDVCRSGLRGYEIVLANSGRTRIDRHPGTCP